MSLKLEFVMAEGEPTVNQMPSIPPEPFAPIPMVGDLMELFTDFSKQLEKPEPETFEITKRRFVRNKANELVGIRFDCVRHYTPGQ